VTAPEWDGYSRRAQYYAVEYQTDVDRPLLEGHVTSDVGSILEIPCGAGRNLAWLAGTGRLVLCADIEPAMIDVVEEEIAALGVGDRVRARVADMRTLELGQTFDLALVPQEAIQLLAGPDDVTRALRAVAGSLAPGGTLLVDLFDFRAGARAATGTLPDYYDPARPDGVAIEDWIREADGGLHLRPAQLHPGGGDGAGGPGRAARGAGARRLRGERGPAQCSAHHPRPTRRPVICTTSRILVLRCGVSS
jgi:SAM-dependent methyltransferase